MYSGGQRRQRPGGGAGYLARPRLGGIKGIYTNKFYNNRPLSGYSYEKKRKSNTSKNPTIVPTNPKMDYRKRPDYADTAYREAVSRLRILLAESYTPIRKPLRDLRELDSGGEETDNQSLLSGASRQSQTGHHHQHFHRTSPMLNRRYPYFSSQLKTRPNYTLQTTTDKTLSEAPPQWDGKQQPPPELMTFIERQEDYIEQLEREARFCRDELAGLLGKVKEVISENEHLHERQKSKLMKSVFDHLETETETETDADVKNIPKSPSKSKAKKSKILEGPSIVFESRISELEAQLTQTKIDLRKAQDENDSYKRKISDGTLGDSASVEAWKKQADAAQREKTILQETVNKLQAALLQLRDRENDTSHQVKRSLDVAEQAQYERSAAEQEIRRLKDELERQHSKLRDTISEQGRRIAEERSAVERRYSQQMDQLNAELGVQWETTSKLQLELDKQRRDDSDLRRDLAQKLAYIEELKKEMQNKMGFTVAASMQSDLTANGAERGALEQRIATLQLDNERIERQSRQEAARLQAETQSLRQRLDRADADLIHSRRENLRLQDQIASLEKEIALNAALSDEKAKRIGGGSSVAPTSTAGSVMALPPPQQSMKNDREKELTSLIKDMENKHVATVAELEGMIQSQNQLMEKLTGECHILTQKLEEASTRHKEEIQQLQANLDYLTNQFSQQAQISNSTLNKDDKQHNQPNSSSNARGGGVSTVYNPSIGTPPNEKYGKNRANNGIMSRTSSNASSVGKQHQSPALPVARLPPAAAVQDETEPQYQEQGNQQAYQQEQYVASDQQPQDQQPYDDQQQYYAQDGDAQQQQYQQQYGDAPQEYMTQEQYDQQYGIAGDQQQGYDTAQYDAQQYEDGGVVEQQQPQQYSTTEQGQN